MNAIHFLKKQHRETEKVFSMIEKAKGRKGALVQELANALAGHMALEHQILYPAAAEVDPELISEAFEEHSIAEIALKRLLATDVDSEAFEGRVTVLKELIEHHVKEEEKELFPQLEKKLGKALLTTMGEQMEALYAKLEAAGPMRNVPRSASQTAADRDRKKIDARA